MNKRILLLSTTFLCVFYLSHVSASDFNSTSQVSVKALSKNCRAGIAADCTRYGDLHANWKFGKPISKKAKKYYLKGCKAGDPFACGKLGKLKFYSKGKRDFEKEFTYQRIACEGGDGLSCKHLPEKRRNPDTYEKALKSFKVLCEQSDPRGCTFMGDLHSFGQLVSEDHRLALSLYQKACELDDARGCLKLAFYIYQGKSTETDKSKALVLAEKACVQGYGEACSHLGAYYMSRKNSERDPAKGLSLMKEGCDKGDNEMCSSLLTHGLFSSAMGLKFLFFGHKQEGILTLP